MKIIGRIIYWGLIIGLIVFGVYIYNTRFFNDYYKTMKRELYEEVGLELDDKNIIKDFYLKYLKVPSVIEEELSFGVLYKIDLNISFEEFNNEFEIYKKYLRDNDLEVEFTGLYGIDKTKESVISAAEKFPNKIPKYIIQMFLKEIESKN